MTMCTELDRAPSGAALATHCCPICNAKFASGDELGDEGVSFECGAHLVAAGHGSWTLTVSCPTKLVHAESDDAFPVPPVSSPSIFELAMF
jgi:hypothetical protein